MKDIQHKLAVARGEKPADLVFRNGRIVNVLSGEIHGGDIAVSGGRIAGIGDYDGTQVVDLAGRCIAPAFIDGHIHIESTMLTVKEFARAVVPRGTGAVVVDPHEFANVVGLAGIDYILNAARLVPLSIFVMMSSCVPATPLETAGATITVGDIASYMKKNDVAGVAEMMNFPGVFLGMESELKKAEHGRDKTIDGHSPGLTGHNLNAYILAGISSDHECTTLEEAKEKLRRGMHILMREGTAERNLHDLLPLITPANSANVSFATDDKHPAELEDEGHIDFHVREAIKSGVEPVTAIQMATINTARHYRLRNLGAIAPRYWADLVVFEDPLAPVPDEVYHRGELVAQAGKYLPEQLPEQDITALKSTMNVAPLQVTDLQVQARDGKALRVIETIPGQIVTKERLELPRVVDGMVVPDINRDILKLAVVERHNSTGNVGIGFVKGFGMKSGALGSTVAHDAHNIIVVGTDDDEMFECIRELQSMQGGLCIVNKGSVVQHLSLPLAGLVSDQPLEYVRRKVDDLISAASQLGCTLPNPFMTLSFLALSPIPALKVTDLGLVDAVNFKLTDLFTDN